MFLKEIIRDADEICNHYFDLLGSGKINLGSKINWHQDFKSKKIWPYWLPSWLIRYEFGKGFDIKVPWELSRFYHLPILAKAYNLTGNKKYIQEIQEEILDWIKKNPYGFGVNWKCTMEVAIRACNWCLIWQYIKDLDELDRKFIKIFLNSLYQHGKFIYSHLESGHSNHYLSNLVGLVYLGIFFPDFKESKKWLKKGIKGLEEEIRTQVNEDGCNWENSISYHRLVTELFGYSALFCKLNNIELSDYFWNKLRKMFDFAAYYIKPNGRIPQLGDNDNGRLHIFNDYYNWTVNDHRYLLDLAREIWKDYKSPEVKSKSFFHSGYYIIRHNDNYMFITANKVGTGELGNHKHNDILSFELQINGRDFIVDPGTYVYTSYPEWRNKFRSTVFHNTVVVDNEEQNRFVKNNLFSLRSDAKIKINKWEIHKDFDILDAEHNGYARLRDPVIHRRQIIFNKKDNYWIIKDILTGRGRHSFDLYFHFSQIALERDSENSLFIRTKNVSGLNLAVFPLKTKDLNLSIRKSWISPSYGIKIPAPVVKYSKITETPTEFVTLFLPFKNFMPDIDSIKKTVKDFLENNEKLKI